MSFIKDLLKWGAVRGSRDPVTGRMVITEPGIGTETSGLEMLARANVGNSVLDARDHKDVIATKSVLLRDWCQQTALPSTTSAAVSIDQNISRWGFSTLKVVPSSATGSFRKNSLALSLDPVQKLATIDVYIPHVVSGSEAINVTFYNATDYSGAYTTWGFNQLYLRQGWNTLSMWCDDTTATQTSPPTGTLAWGAAKTIGTGGFDAASPIGSFEMTFYNGTDKSYYVDGLRKGAKARPCLVMGWDSTGYDGADNVFTDTVAPYLTSLGIKAYFTCTALWDLFDDTAVDAARKDILYRTHGWDCLPHFWNHGITMPGIAVNASSAARSGNVVTVTMGSSLTSLFSTPVATGNKFYCMISGATGDTAYNGLQYCSVTGSTTFKYNNVGSNGSATGTIAMSTKADAMLAVDTPLRRSLFRHEIVDLVQLLRARGWVRGLNIGGYPTSVVGCMELMAPIFEEAGIKYYRGSRTSTVAVTEFGVDNPFHFGTAEMGNNATSYNLQQMKDSLTGAIGRGHHQWTVGHYMLDETDPANSAHANADLAYPPGVNGNPSAPTASGWWYLGTLKRFLNEAVLPLVAAGTLDIKSPTEWAASLGNLYEPVRAGHTLQLASESFLGAKYSTRATVTTGNIDLAASEVCGAKNVVFRHTGGSTPGASSFPTAQAITAVMSGLAIGDSYVFRYINNCSGTVPAFAASAGITFTGTMTIATNTYRDFAVTRTNDEAFTVQSIGTGTDS